MKNEEWNGGKASGLVILNEGEGSPAYTRWEMFRCAQHDSAILHSSFFIYF